MRTSTFFAGIAASAALSLGLVGVASAAPAATAANEPAALTVSPSAAAPGATVQISGTCAMPTSGTDFPTVTSVSSPAFSGPATFINKAPDSFSGTATISSSASTGSYPVTLTCSNGTAASTIQVNGGSPKPTPKPTPATGGSTGHQSGTTGGSGAHSDSGTYTGIATGTGSGTDSGTGSGDTTATGQTATEQDNGLSGWEIGGIVVLGLGAAGVGGYAIARRNRQNTDV